LRRDTFLKGTRRGSIAKDVAWLHHSGREMLDADWNDSNLRSISVLMNGAASRGNGEGDLFVIFNADDEGLEVPLPPAPEGTAWSVAFDTGEPDRGANDVRLAVGTVIAVRPQSTVLLESKNT
jgi:pullulanase/glycogen debranching enzyme